MILEQTHWKTTIFVYWITYLINLSLHTEVTFEVFRIAETQFLKNTLCFSTSLGIARLTGKNTKFSSIFRGETYV